MHTSHPRAGWENRCQQFTTHPAGKEPDRISNEQQAATNPSPLQEVPQTCRTMSSTLLSVAHPQEVVHEHKRLCEALFVSAEWRIRCRATEVSRPPHGRWASSRVQCPAAKHFPWVPWSTPFPLHGALFSHENVCKWYSFESSGNHVGAKKEVSLRVSGGSSRSLSCRTSHVALDSKEPFCQSYLLRVTLMGQARGDGGHLSNHPLPNLIRLPQASRQGQNQTCRQPSFSFLTTNKVNNSTVTIRKLTNKEENTTGEKGFRSMFIINTTPDPQRI